VLKREGSPAQSNAEGKCSWPGEKQNAKEKRGSGEEIKTLRTVRLKILKDEGNGFHEAERVKQEN